MKHLPLLALTLLLPACSVTGTLRYVEEPALSLQTDPTFGNGVQYATTYTMPPFATAVLRTRSGATRRVDIRPNQAAALRQREGQIVTLPWIP